jgi:hypothetical protein
VALLLCAQAAFHAVATWAPWAVGLGGHAHPAALAPGSLAAHAAAALVLGVLLVRGSRLLDAAVRVARRLRRPARGRTGPPPQPAPAHATPTPRSAIAGRGAGARAPPAGAVVAA